MIRHIIRITFIALLLAADIPAAQAQTAGSDDPYSTYQPGSHFSLKAQYKLRRHLRKGNRAYWKKDYNTAAQKYNDAAAADSTSHKATYNAGNAMYRKGAYDEAAQRYNEVLSNPALQGKQRAFAFYNLGNSLLQQALQQRRDLRRSIHTGIMANSAGDGGMEKLMQAISNFQESLKLNPTDMKAKYNLSYARKLLTQMEASSATAGGNGKNGNNGQQGGQGQQEVQGSQSPDGRQANQGTQGQQGGQYGNTGHDTGKGNPGGTGQNHTDKQGSSPQGQGKGQQGQQGKPGNQGQQSNQEGDRNGKGSGTENSDGHGDRDGNGTGSGHGNGEGLDPDQLRKKREETERRKREAEQLLNAMKNYELNTMRNQTKAHAKTRSKIDKDW